MILVSNDMVEVGNFVKFRGHRVQMRLQDRWYKVTAIEDGVIRLVDRHGGTARMRTNRRFQDTRALKWEPGDDRNDGI